MSTRFGFLETIALMTYNMDWFVKQIWESVSQVFWVWNVCMEFSVGHARRTLSRIPRTYNEFSCICTFKLPCFPTPCLESSLSETIQSA